jgi:hypothetical protein
VVAIAARVLPFVEATEAASVVEIEVAFAEATVVAFAEATVVASAVATEAASAGAAEEGLEDSASKAGECRACGVLQHPSHRFTHSRRVYLEGVPATVDARITDNSQDALVASFQNLSVSQGPNELPPRPDFGKQGRAIVLRTNFFPVTVPKGPVFEYDVTITPAAGTAMRRVKRRIWHLAEDSPEWTQKGLKGVVAHDHSQKLIAAKKLQQPLTITGMLLSSTCISTF